MKKIVKIASAVSAIVGFIAAIVGIANDALDLKNKLGFETTTNAVVDVIPKDENTSQGSGLPNIIDDFSSNETEQVPSTDKIGTLNDDAEGVEMESHNTSNYVTEVSEDTSENTSVNASEPNSEINNVYSCKRIAKNVICACVTDDGYAYIDSDLMVCLSDGTSIELSEFDFDANRLLEYNTSIGLVYNPYDGYVYFIHKYSDRLDAYVISNGVLEQIYIGEREDTSWRDQGYYAVIEGYFISLGELVFDRYLFDLKGQTCAGPYYDGWLINGKTYKYAGGLRDVETNEVIVDLGSSVNVSFYDGKLYLIDISGTIRCFDGYQIDTIAEMTGQPIWRDVTLCLEFYAGPFGYVYIDSKHNMYVISSSS